MPPYRSARVDAPKLTPTPGVVDDMVRQFADRHAFLRELVQNGIDAGATRIDVRIERSPDGAVRTSVEDDGAGMTRAIIEGPLLTLFESSKESDSSKIGKYGIGFVSVFATEPDRVDVRTRRAKEAWMVRLFGDHSFELATDAPRPGTGTEVILLHTMTAEQLAAHAAMSKTALLRWCRHAHVPITFTVLDGYDGGATEKINAELTLPGAASVVVEEGVETFVVAAGHVDGETTMGGFYNRGLTLMESAEAESGLEGIRFKIDSPRLSHTLSRDSVRRDDQLRRVLERVRELVRSALWPELQRRIAEAAEEAATGACEPYSTMLQAALVPSFVKDIGSVVVPLVEPIAGARTMALGAVRSDDRRYSVLVGDASTPLTRALAATGRPVMRHTALAPILRTTVKGICGVEHAFAFAGAVEERPEDVALRRELERLLHAAGRGVACVRLAVFDGVASDSSCRVVKTTEESALTPPEDAMARAWGSSATLFLNAEHATVRLARRRAKSDASVAGQLLVRAIAIAEGPLAPKIVDRLLAAASGANDE